MPRLTPADASLILDHVVGNPSAPAAAANALLASLPFPSRPTPRLLRAVLLRRLASDPVSAKALDSLELLASLPSPAPRVAAAHRAVAAFLAASAPDFDAAARALFARPGGRARRAADGNPALASPEAATVADQFEAAVGNAFMQGVLRALWGKRAAAEGRVRELLAAEWAAIGPSMLEVAAERIVGDGAVETWRTADESTRAKYLMLGEDASILAKCSIVWDLVLRYSYVIK
jgi:telomeric repeat-binding factor 2